MSKRDRSEFSLEGRFLGFSPQGTTDNKYIDLLTAQGDIASGCANLCGLF
ncbi:MAG: hypothetical protein HC886_05020 [Leptolyngbyaceae cyanobacterium SM1_1_3]|nr:hypothetical protein [Leptolyngbyaceae cyanobacterium SM1_1_3]